MEMKKGGFLQSRGLGVFITQTRRVHVKLQDG